eukprot:4506834-Pyramimonas_sp.AAC.1
MEDLRSRVRDLEAAGPGSSSSSPKFLQLLNSMDISHRRVAFVGFSDLTSAAVRLEVIENFVKQHVGANFVST